MSPSLPMQTTDRPPQANPRHDCDDALRLNAMFADVLGHDLRSPLSAILMSAEILKRRPDAALQKTGVRLSRSANWMARMIQDLLDLTHSRLGQALPLQCQAADMALLLRAVVAQRTPEFPGNALQLDLQGDLCGSWDAVRVQQLLSGLVGNALHHGEPGQPVWLRADGLSPDTVCVEIRNRGAIAPTVLPHVFDPLHAAGRRPSPPEGLGFGLYIARQIARAHGGDLVLQSDTSSGTRVQVTLPRVAPTVFAAVAELAQEGDAMAGATAAASAPHASA